MEHRTNETERRSMIAEAARRAKEKPRGNGHAPKPPRVRAPRPCVPIKPETEPEPMDETAYCRGCNFTFTIEAKVGEHYVERLPDGSKRWHPVVDCDAGVLH